MCRLYNNILDVPGRRRLSDSAMGPDPNSDAQAPSQPSGTGVPVYVMLPLDTVWLVARDGRSSSVREPPKPEDSCAFSATPPVLCAATCYVTTIAMCWLHGPSFATPFCIASSAYCSGQLSQPAL